LYTFAELIAMGSTPTSRAIEAWNAGRIFVEAAASPTASNWPFFRYSESKLE
jgi:hypothetical protein